MSVSENLAAVRERIARAARAAGRDPADVRLVAVSKTFPVAAVRQAAAAGQVDFGENRVQEAFGKMDELSGDAGGGAGATDLGVRWHLIGHLQSNKARKAAARFACIQSIDRLEILEAVDRASVASQSRPELLVQVDLAGEVTKFGAKPSAVPAIFDAARRLVAARVVGLMVLPPFLDDPEAARPFFRQLRDLRRELAASGVPDSMLRELSMGMSRDLDVAVSEGATIVRVGTAIFGTRHV